MQLLHMKPPLNADVPPTPLLYRNPRKTKAHNFICLLSGTQPPRKADTGAHGQLDARPVMIV